MDQKERIIEAIDNLFNLRDVLDLDVKDLRLLAVNMENQMKEVMGGNNYMLWEYRGIVIVI